MREVERLLDVVRFHTVRQVDGGGARRLAVEVWAERVRRLVRVGVSVSARADGFASRTPGSGDVGSGKGGRQRMAVPDGEGGMDLVPTSSTEVAALRPVSADPVALQAGEALAALRRVVAALDDLDRVLGRFDRLQSTAAVPDPPMCWVAQVRYRLPYDVLWDVQLDGRATDFVGVLAEPFDEPRRVCMFVYWFARNHRRLPSRAEMVAHLERSTVKVRA